ncbi:MAG: hypothetical protein ACP5K1_03000 [Candidatus Bathyarchaeia archaeon]
MVEPPPRVCLGLEGDSLAVKEEFLKAPKEDEKFRYAVVGYLNLSELRDALTKLAEAQARTEERLDELSAAVKTLSVQVGRLSDAVGFLVGGCR